MMQITKKNEQKLVLGLLQDFIDAYEGNDAIENWEYWDDSNKIMNNIRIAKRILKRSEL